MKTRHVITPGDECIGYPPWIESGAQSVTTLELEPDLDSSDGVVGGIVLCGGQSRRMGYPKADLPFGDQTLLSRTVDVVASQCHPVVVVAAVGQALPVLPEGVLVARDRRDSRGPLEGIAAGMARLKDAAERERTSGAGPLVQAAFVTACDVPLLLAAWIRFMIDQMHGEYDVAVPRCERFYHPLSAVYRMRVLPVIQSLLAEEWLRAAHLFDHVPTHEVSMDVLRQVDPDLVSLQNINTPQQYLAMLQRCGFPADRNFVERYFPSRDRSRTT